MVDLRDLWPYGAKPITHMFSEYGECKPWPNSFSDKNLWSQCSSVINSKKKRQDDPQSRRTSTWEDRRTQGFSRETGSSIIQRGMDTKWIWQNNKWTACSWARVWRPFSTVVSTQYWDSKLCCKHPSTCQREQNFTFLSFWTTRGVFISVCRTENLMWDFKGVYS